MNTLLVYKLKFIVKLLIIFQITTLVCGTLYLLCMKSKDT